MERMTPDTDKREGLGEGIYAKFVQNYEKLLEENKKLKEINESQNEEIQRFKDNAMQDMREITELEIENKNLKEELSKLKEKYGDIDY